MKKLRLTKIISIVGAATALLGFFLPFILIDGRKLSYISFLARNYALVSGSTQRLTAFICYLVPVALTVAALALSFSHGRATMAFAGLGILSMVCVMVFLSSMFNEYSSVKELFFSLRPTAAVYFIGHIINLAARGREKVYQQ